MPTMFDEILDTYNTLISGLTTLPGLTLEDAFPDCRPALEAERAWLLAQIGAANFEAQVERQNSSPPGPTHHDLLVAFVSDLRHDLEVAEARWVTPESVDDAEEMWNEYPDFISATLTKLRAIAP